MGTETDQEQILSLLRKRGIQYDAVTKASILVDDKRIEFQFTRSGELSSVESRES